MSEKPKRGTTKRTRVKIKPWPYPGDSREEKARRVAQSYRQLVIEIAQNRCDDPAGALYRLDHCWADLGIYWPVPSDVPLDPDDWMSAPDLAHAINRDRRDIYNWARLGRIEQRAGADGTPEYSVESVFRYSSELRRRRGLNTVVGGS